MFTTKNPSHCPKCGSKNVVLGCKEYEKDAFGEETEVVISGSWFCKDCGDFIGGKNSKYDNDISEESI